jgi:exo-beta-1,3-glucanase (GH17 family)
MATMTRKTARAFLIATILLIAVGGIAAGIYFGVHNNGKSSSSDKAGSESTGPAPTTAPKTNSTGNSTTYTVSFPDSEKSAAVNFDARFEPIARQNIFYGLSYSAYGLGDNRVCPPYDDVGGICLLPGQVLADMRTISSLTNRVKLYSLDCYTATQVVLEYAKANGMSVMLGIFISKDKKSNEKEISYFQSIAKTYGSASAITEIMVGNEAIFVEGASVSQLTEAISAVRSIAAEAGIKATIGSAEIMGVWSGQQNPPGTKQIPSVDIAPVIKALDWIGLNTHPYYSSQDPTAVDAGKEQVGSAKSLAAYLKGKGFDKPVYITETGYPDKGPTSTSGSASAVPSVKGMEAFATEVELAARAAAIPSYYFEPINADWKRRWAAGSAEVDFNFGLFYCDRSLKPLQLPPPGAL